GVGDVEGGAADDEAAVLLERGVAERLGGQVDAVELVDAESAPKREVLGIRCRSFRAHADVEKRGHPPILDVCDKPQREEFAVRPRTIPTKVSTSAVVRSRRQTSATVEVGPSRSGRWSTSLRWCRRASDIGTTTTP